MLIADPDPDPTPDSWHVTPYQRRHRETVLDLMFESRRTHVHLDWYRVGTWLDADGVGVRLVWDGERLIGCLGVSAPLYTTAWIRIAAVSNEHDSQAVLACLWDDMKHLLHAQRVDAVGIMVVNKWISAYLGALGFRYHEDVVTLQSQTETLPPPPIVPQVRVQNAYAEHLNAMIAIDHRAFDPIWRMGGDEIRQAQRHSASCTIASIKGDIVGYQISTRHHGTGHLARLAVLPQLQGQHIGAVLLDHLMSSFHKRGVRYVTVNTQRSNWRSHHLYQRYGFRHNGFDLPMWIAQLGEATPT